MFVKLTTVLKNPQEGGGRGLEASRHQISNSYSTKRTSNIFGHHLPVMKKVSAIGS